MSPTIIGIAVMIVALSLPWFFVESAISRSKQKPKSWPLIRKIVFLSDFAVIALFWVLGFARELGEFGLEIFG